MKHESNQSTQAKSPYFVAVSEEPSDEKDGILHCRIGDHIKFETEGLEAYFCAEWDQKLYDLLVLAGSIEFCDRAICRSTVEWAREIHLSLPVHEPDQWNDGATKELLCRALSFLTGDCWYIHFNCRKRPVDKPRQGLFDFLDHVTSVIPFSEGLDSLAAARISELKHKKILARVRLGSARAPRDFECPQRAPFATVPYKIQGVHYRLRESSQRHRGFKFAALCGIAASLAKCVEVIIPESGQGAIGPSLVTAGQGYPDYRSHPRFLRFMEQFPDRILERKLCFLTPRIWFTKGETLKEYVELNASHFKDLRSTRSCWQQARQIGFEGRFPQCGICAACMLRRMSMHAAGLSEPNETYLWEDLSAQSFVRGCASGFPRITESLKEYAIAGALHLDHLAEIGSSSFSERTLNRESLFLSQSTDMSQEEVNKGMRRMLGKHREEWKEFLESLGKDSFILRMIGR